MALVAQYLFADAPASPAAIDAVAAHNGTVGGDASYDGCSLTVSGNTLSAFASSSNAALAPNAAGTLSIWMSWPDALSAYIRDDSGVPNGDNGWLMVTRKSGGSVLTSSAARPPRSRAAPRSAPRRSS
jgi:hypothetical protein